VPIAVEGERGQEEHSGAHVSPPKVTPLLQTDAVNLAAIAVAKQTHTADLLPPKRSRTERVERVTSGEGRRVAIRKGGGLKEAHWNGPPLCPGMLMGAKRIGMAADATTASGRQPELITR
jgi:hypothetical protein